MEEDYKCRNWSLNASYKYNSVSGEVFAIADILTNLTNIDIDMGILQNIDTDKILYR